MRLATLLMYDGNPRSAADQVVSLEKAGLDSVWVAEAYGFDSPTLMGYLAAKTETVQIGSGILNIYSRTPGALLQTAAGLDNVSGGRAILGIGVSGPQVIEGFHGVPYRKPMARTQEVVEIIRSGLKREPLSADGEFHLPLTKEHGAVTGLGKPLKLLTRPERDTIPIWIAALGPKMLAMSARRSLGTIPYFSSVDHTRAARAAVGPDALVIPEVAYVLDEEGDFGRRCNMAMVELEMVKAEDERNRRMFHQMDNWTGPPPVDVMGDMTRFDAERLQQLIANHARLTGSTKAQAILDDWAAYLPKFRKVMPVEYRRALKELKAKSVNDETPIAIGA